MTQPASSPDSCPFCRTAARRVFHEGRRILGLWDGFPVSPGHALLIPRRHVATWFDASPEEQAELVAGIEIARQEILKHHQPDGFNIGINVGAAAGQTVFHLHVHVIPRYLGDVPDPRGGVRHVVPAKANYLASPSAMQGTPAGTAILAPVPTEPGLLASPEHPLLPRLTAAIDRATEADLCVAFVLPSGVELVRDHLADLLARGGRLRLVTGDYLDVTDPDALARLMDLGPRAEIRVFQSRGRSFHPKGYRIGFADGSAIAFIGSSNLSASALRSGIEWNWQVVSSRDQREVAGIRAAFDHWFGHPDTCVVTEEWLGEYRRRRPVPSDRGTRTELGLGGDVIREEVEPRPEQAPTAIQREALAALEATRVAGNRAGLVVLATGLGKTWLAAFDSRRFRRVLFVAHREEILAQAQGVFRRVRPDASTGFYTGDARMPEADILLASVQTLGRQPHLRQFARDRFDYVVIDEFHHAAAPTYRALLGHFEPQFFLGLTATPDRSDGADLLALCGENLVYDCDLVAGIRRLELSPFRYFGLPDLVDYERIPWRSNRFDEAALTEAVATLERANHVLRSWQQHGGSRTVAFCVSQRHADFMAAHFDAAGVPSVAVHAGPGSSPRRRALDLLNEGSLKVLFVVDLFNEGLDLPAIDTVLMLRPTASISLWLQQFGRGLRKSPGKSHLTVVDFVGNHRVFLTAPRALLGVDGRDVEVRSALVQLRRSPEDWLPPGCSIDLDPVALDLLNEILRVRSSSHDVEDFARGYLALHGRRPTASEAWHAGLDPKKNPFQSWTRLLVGMDALIPADSQQALQGLPSEAREFLRQLEVTPMSRSYKMLLLLAWIEAAEEGHPATFPGAITIGHLVQFIRRLASRGAVLQRDLGPSYESEARLRRHLEDNPIAAWTDGKGTGGVSYFQYEGETLRTRPLLALADPEAARCFREWVVELAEWRLAEYLGREVPRPFRAKVSHASGNPILFLPGRNHRPDLPMGWAGIRVDGAAFEANFVKIAINVVRAPGSAENQLGSILRKWFGPLAGTLGRRDQVRFQPIAGGAWELFPEPGTPA